LAERDFPKVEVAGSCPVSRSELSHQCHQSKDLPRLAHSWTVDRALIQFICVRKTHRRKPPVDPSSPYNVAEEGGWAYCPGGEPDGHKWFKTGGITRAALAKFDWPDEEEAEA
jgi:hypothetical protein